MSRIKSREQEIYNYIKENENTLYSIKSLSKLFDTSEEGIKRTYLL